MITKRKGLKKSTVQLREQQEHSCQSVKRSCRGVYLLVNPACCFVLFLHSLHPFRQLLSNYTTRWTNMNVFFSHHANVCTKGHANLFTNIFWRHGPFWCEFRDGTCTNVLVKPFSKSGGKRYCKTKPTPSWSLIDISKCNNACDWFL